MKKKDSHPRPPTHSFVIEGFSELREFLVHSPNMIRRIVVKNKNDLGLFESFSIKKNKLIESKELKESECFSDAPLWGIVEILPMSDKEFFDGVESSPPSVVVALDHVTDPRNVGAIARTAAFFGIRYLVVCRDRQALITPAVVSTSQGGLALTRLVVVTNLSRFLNEMKTRGYWIIGTDLKGEDYKIFRKEYEKNVLVLGSEQKGLSHLIRKHCDRFATIFPKNGQFTLDSLNISVAAGIILAEMSGRASDS